MPPPRFLLPILIATGLALLIYNAATTTVWDDETNGFFLARQPLPHLMQAMGGNVHEDPPLFDVLLHFWLKVAGYHPWALRMLSVFFWVLTLVGLHRAGTQTGGKGAGLLCVAVAVCMPYHWMFPAAMRWYSLFACLTVWNFLAFQRLVASETNGLDLRGRLLPLLGYMFSGAALWYTNYSAPAVFLAHGVVAVVTTSSRARLRVLLPLVLAWGGIGLLYLPWLPVFIRQLAHSAAPFSAKATAASIYALWAGEVSTPFAWWISIPVLVAAVTACGLIVVRFRHCALPALIAAVLLFILVAKNVIWTKRLLIFTPFLALAIGLALHSAPQRRTGLWTKLRRVFLAASAIAICGSLANVFRREGWMTYRWVVPVESVVRQTLAARQDTVLLTNSNCVAFYAADPVGLNMATLRPELARLMKSLPCYPGFSPVVETVVSDRLRLSDSAAYIHDSSSVRFTDVSAWLTQTMQTHGFVLTSIENHSEASAEYLRFHPGGGRSMAREDRSRLLVVHFRRSTNL